MKKILVFCFFFYCLLSHSMLFATGNIPKASFPKNLRFTENKNQWDNKIFYRADVPAGKLFLEDHTFTYMLFDPAGLERLHMNAKDFTLKEHVFKEEFVNASPDAHLGKQPYPDYANYFIGNNPAKWASNVSIYNAVVYKNLYPDIDMNVHSKYDQLKYDLIINPGGNAAEIKIKYTGTDQLFLENGDLHIATSIGTLIEQRPYAYQLIKGKEIKVDCRFILNENILTFSIGNYRNNYPLIIDPTLVFSTYTGSAADNFGYTATYDNGGNMYLGGLVNDFGYPLTTGAIQTFFAGGSFTTGIHYPCDMSITKLNSSGNALIYSTYLGGSDNDTPHSLYVDGNNELCIYGRSYSHDFPTTSTAYDTSSNGRADIVVVKFNSSGTALLGSTYVGGSDDDGVNFSAAEDTSGNLKYNYGDDARGEIYTDSLNNIYIASCTKSANFPVSSGAFQTSIGGQQDGCVFKLNPNLTSLIWSSFMGGSSDDACYSLTLQANTVYVAGGTMSANFPTTAAALHSSFLGGMSDGFVAHFNANGSTLLASTFVGTNSYDQVYFVKLDNSNSVYIVGETEGAYPVISAVYSNPNSGQFITKLNPALSSVTYSTVFGNGNNFPNISPTAFLVDTCENVYVSGWGGVLLSTWLFPWTDITSMPLTSDAFQSTTDGIDFYIFVLKKDAQSLLYASYFGGNGAGEHVDGGTSRFDKDGIMYQAICAGCGGNSLTPTTPGVWSNTNNSFNCNELGFKMRFDFTAVSAQALANPAATGCAPLNVNFINNSVNATQYQWDFGDGTAQSALFQPPHTFIDTGTYIIRLIATNPDACIPIDTSYTTVVVFTNNVVSNYTSIVTDFCDSISVQFNNTSSGTATTFQWNFGDSTSSTLPNPVHVYKVLGTYTVTLTVQDTTACNPFDTISKQIIFNSRVEAVIPDSAYTGCSPLNIQFNDTGFGGINFFWDFRDGTTSTLKNPNHTFINPGVYNVMLIVTDTATCNGSDTSFSRVTVYPQPPQAMFTATPRNINLNTAVHFTNTTTGATFNYWQFGDGDTSTVLNPVHQYTRDGDFTACLFVSNGGQCTDSACTIIYLRLTPIVDVPNAFSPNGDGQNEILYVRGQGLTRLDFKVFNRWGEIVFETNDINKGWDGTYKGKPQEAEVYVWQLSGTFGNGEITQRSGNVTLLR